MSLLIPYYQELSKVLEIGVVTVGVLVVLIIPAIRDLIGRLAISLLAMIISIFIVI